MPQTLTATQPEQNTALKKRYTFKQVLSAANLAGYKIYPLYHSQQGYGIDILEGWETPKNMISGFLTLVSGYSWIINNPASKIDCYTNEHLDRSLETPSSLQPIQKEEPAPQITTAESDQTTVVYVNDIAIASIAYNDSDRGSYITHPWVVMVEGNEVHNAATWQQAYRYITWHHKQNFQSLVGSTGASGDVEQVETMVAQTEIDSIPDQRIGELCRLWHNTTLLGTFYRKIFTDEWIATPTDNIHPYHCPSEDDARYWLVAHHLNAAFQSLIGVAGVSDSGAIAKG